jgi:outer membrane protein TolC
MPRRCFILFLLGWALGLTGCVTFQPQPISLSQTAQDFENRSLEDTGLRTFIEKNLQERMPSWPPRLWDFSMLEMVAFYYHPDLDVARARWSGARGGIITAGERPNPGLSVAPEYNANTSPGVSPWLLTLNLDLPVETANKRGYRIAKAKYRSESARLHLVTTAWQVRNRLRTGLIHLYALTQAESLLQRQEYVQNKGVTLLEERLTVGEISQIELTQARIATSQIQLQQKEIKKQKAEIRVEVASALGLPLKAIEKMEISFEMLNKTPLSEGLSVETLRRQALTSRSDILSSLSDYAASQSNLQLEIAKQFPDIHLGPGYMWDQTNNLWSIGLTLVLPLFNQNQGSIAEAEAHRKEAAANLLALQDRIIGEIDRASHSYRTAWSVLDAANHLLNVKHDQQQSIEALWKGGEADRLGYLQVQIEALSVEQLRLDTFIKLQDSLLQFEEALQQPLLETTNQLPSVETDLRSKPDGHQKEEKKP